MRRSMLSLRMVWNLLICRFRFEVKFGFQRVSDVTCKISNVMINEKEWDMYNSMLDQLREEKKENKSLLHLLRSDTPYSAWFFWSFWKEMQTKLLRFDVIKRPTL